MLCVDYFPRPKKNESRERFDEEIEKFERLARGQKFLTCYGEKNMQQDWRLFFKRGGMFNILKTWIRTRSMDAKSAAKTISKWCEQRLEGDDIEVMKLAVKNRQFNRVESMLQRQQFKINHPFLSKVTEANITRSSPMGIIIPLNVLENPNEYDMDIHIFVGVRVFQRYAMHEPLVRRRGVLR